MRPLLKHLIEITAYRDQDRLEASVASSLGNMVGAIRVRKLETVSSEDDILLRSTELRVAQDPAARDAQQAQPDAPAIVESLDGYPELLACIERSEPSAERHCDDGRYVLWLPVRLDGKVRTCLEITSARRYGSRTRAVILGIFEVYCNYQSLLDYSERDALTGLFNRKTFEDQFPRHRENAAPPRAGAVPPPREAASDAGDGIDLERELSALDGDAFQQIQDVEGGGTPSPAPDPAQEAPAQWLAVVDIDHFKSVNDRFGHVYGDEVLILVSNILKSSFRGDDRIFRFGGEEFVVLLRQVPLSTAWTIFERFRRNVEQHAFPQVGRVTVSLGFARTDAGTPVEILGRADQALYFAKEHGRNRTCHYEALVRDGSLQPGMRHADIELF
jgi:diguanylate cyclase (GGDEF)-like protein